MKSAPDMRLLALVVLFVACSGPIPVHVDRIAVEGTVTVRGNEPFTGVWLETDDRNIYLLRLDPGERTMLVTPGRYRAIGVVSVDEWNGLRMTFLDVENLVPYATR